MIEAERRGEEYGLRTHRKSAKQQLAGKSGYEKDTSIIRESDRFEGKFGISAWFYQTESIRLNESSGA